MLDPVVKFCADLKNASKIYETIWIWYFEFELKFGAIKSRKIYFSKKFGQEILGWLRKLQNKTESSPGALYATVDTPLILAKPHSGAWN